MKKEKYVDFMSKTPLINELTTKLCANELYAKALAKVLIDKGIISGTELQEACSYINRKFIEQTLGELDESNVPDFVDFSNDD